MSNKIQILWFKHDERTGKRSATVATDTQELSIIISMLLIMSTFLYKSMIWKTTKYSLKNFHKEICIINE